MRAACLLVAVTMTLGACVRDEGSLIVFAASSFADVMRELAPGARINAAGSDTLASQIREGADADVFVSANESQAQALHAEGLLQAPAVFAHNRLVIIVPDDNPAEIERLEDLERPGVRIVVGAPGLPLGDYTRAGLASLGVTSILENAVSEEQSASAVVGKVALGEADAAFVYATDVASSGGRVRSIELPPNDVKITSTIAVVTETNRPEGARDLVASVLGERGRRALAVAGFTLP